MITLVCGFSGSGKTTLPLLFKGILPWNYVVYSEKYNFRLNIVPNYEVKIARIAREDVVKDYRLDPEFNSDSNYENNKDRQFFHRESPLPLTVIPQNERSIYFSGNSPTLAPQYTFRDKIDSYVTKVRKEDPCYFIRNCYLKSISGNENFNLMITDFRFEEDFYYLKTMNKNINTIRIFNSEVKSTKRFDRKLDYFKTEYLLVPKNNSELHFKKSIEKFPQYKRYVPSHAYFGNDDTYSPF